MLVTCINKFNEFNELKSNWNEVYQDDLHSNFFLSWTWLRSWFEVKPDSWLILGVKPENGDSYVAFFPLGVRITQKHGLYLFGDLYMGGNYWADYTGLICLPEYEERAIDALAEYIQKHLDWERFRLYDILDPRIEKFLSRFSSTKYQVEQNTGKASPYIELPKDWDYYLEKCLGKWLRRDLRRSFREIEASDRLHLTYLEADNLETHIEALLTVNQLRWGKRDELDLDRYRSIFRRCFDDGYLWSCVLWEDRKPIAGLIGFVDRQKKTFFAYLIGHDSAYEKLKPGKTIYAYSIKYAIENGLEIYDLGRGDFDYKYAFGATKRHNTNAIVWRKNLRVKLFHKIDRSKQSIRLIGNRK
jgi:CelD/BcsL family acetyltransferase involved in cellulose biosynthesis